MPFWVECLYTNERYNLYEFPTMVKAIVMLLPSFILYIASNYKPSDRRKIKYWLPYGLMRDRQLKTYGNCIDIGYHSKTARLIRWILPYGYVLWWDNKKPVNQPLLSKTNSEDNRTNNDVLKKTEEVLFKLQKESEETRRGQIELAERIEVSLLKLELEIKNITL